jgi:hypothetical protein
MWAYFEGANKESKQKSPLNALKECINSTPTLFIKPTNPIVQRKSVPAFPASPKKFILIKPSKSSSCTAHINTQFMFVLDTVFIS